MRTKRSVFVSSLATGLALSYSVVLAPGTAQAVSCAQRDVSIVQPVDGGVLKVARVAGVHAGVADKWELKVDGWFCNPTASAYKVGSLRIEHLNNGTSSNLNTAPAAPRADFNTVPSNSEYRLYYFRNQLQFPFPLPQQIRLTFQITDVNGNPLPSIVKTYGVAEHVNPGALGGYFFPAHQSDLPAGSYWMQGRHAEKNTHQRYAYDLWVERWDTTAKAWTKLLPGKTNTDDKTSYLTWNRPVYAMSDGEVIGCNRGAPDNNVSQTVGNTKGGNILWVRNGNETTLYAHLKQNTIPLSLCPFDNDEEHKLGDPNADPPEDAKYKIKAGQYLGQTGTSGSSRDLPHLHIHTFMGLPAIWGGSEDGIDSDSRPLRFVNVRVQERFESSNVSLSQWRGLSRAATLPYQTRIEPNRCRFVPNSTKAQLARLGVDSTCFSEMNNASVYAGYRPVHFDVVGNGATTYSSSLWRPNDGIPWLLLSGLDSAGLQSAHNTHVVGGGYRYLHLETYAQSGALRYAVILVKQPGYTQKAQVGMTSAQLQTYFNNETGNGYRPVQISAADVGGTKRYSALMELRPVGSYAALPEIAITNYQTEYNNQSNAGRTLSYIDGHSTGGQARLSAIWYSSLAGAPTASHGLTSAQMQSAMNSNLTAGRYARSVTAYFDGGLKFAAVWRPLPGTTITSGPSANDQFTFNSTDPLATFECRIDLGAWAACSSPRTALSRTPGQHTFAVRAVDRQRRLDSTPATSQFTV